MKSTRVQQPARLQAWDRIEIIVGEGHDEGHYVARVEDLINEGIIATEPEFISGTVRLRADVEVRVLFTREDAVYQYICKVRRYSGSGGTRRLLLTPPRRIERVQRRMFYRLEISSPMTYQVLPPDAEGPPDPEIPWHDASCINISGSGVLMQVPEELPRRTLILLRVELFRSQGLPGTMVGRCCRLETKDGRIRAGVQFILKDDLSKYFSESYIRSFPSDAVQFDQRKQNDILSFIFQKQIEMRNKGLM